MELLKEFLEISYNKKEYKINDEIITKAKEIKHKIKNKDEYLNIKNKIIKEKKKSDERVYFKMESININDYSSSMYSMEFAINLGIMDLLILNDGILRKHDINDKLIAYEVLRDKSDKTSKEIIDNLRENDFKKDKGDIGICIKRVDDSNEKLSFALMAMGYKKKKSIIGIYKINDKMYFILAKNEKHGSEDEMISTIKDILSNIKTIDEINKIERVKEIECIYYLVAQISIEIDKLILKMNKEGKKVINDIKYVDPVKCYRMNNKEINEYLRLVMNSDIIENYKRTNRESKYYTQNKEYKEYIIRFMRPDKKIYYDTFRYDIKHYYNDLKDRILVDSDSRTKKFFKDYFINEMKKSIIGKFKDMSEEKMKHRMKKLKEKEKKYNEDIKHSHKN
jgi:hypothetical protein